MNEFRLSIYFKAQLGISIGYDYQLFINIPFIEIRFSFSKEARGYSMFGYYK